MTNQTAQPSPLDDGQLGLHVGYILKQYPRLSETFILNEILGVEATGATVSVFSLRPPTEGRFHPDLAAVKADVHYVPGADKAAFLDAVRSLSDLRADRLDDVLAFVDRLPAERRARLVLDAIAVARQVQRSGVDHLHAHFLTVAAHTAHLVHLLTDVPYTVTAHAKDIYRHGVNWEVAARVGSHAAAVVTVCDANLTYLQARLDGSGTRLVRIYNGLGPQAAPAPLEARTPGLVVGVGRLVEKKGFDVLLDAFATIAASRPDARCVLVGDGDCRQALEAQAARLGITDRVTFTGSQPQQVVAEWLRRAHVMAAPCRVGEDGNQDALPTVLLEALGAGLPAVSTPVAGITEIIDHDVEGLIVASDDPDATAAAIVELLESPARWRAMSAAGPRKLASRFDRNETIHQLVGVMAKPKVAAVTRFDIIQISADRGIAPGSTKGAAQHLRGIAAGFQQRGHQVTTYTPRRPEGPFPTSVVPLEPSIRSASEQRRRACRSCTNATHSVTAAASNWPAASAPPSCWRSTHHWSTKRPATDPTRSARPTPRWKPNSLAPLISSSSCPVHWPTGPTRSERVQRSSWRTDSNRHGSQSRRRRRHRSTRWSSLVTQSPGMAPTGSSTCSSHWPRSTTALTCWSSAAVRVPTPCALPPVAQGSAPNSPSPERCHRRKRQPCCGEEASASPRTGARTRSTSAPSKSSTTSRLASPSLPPTKETSPASSATPGPWSIRTTTANSWPRSPRCWTTRCCGRRRGPAAGLERWPP